jgi:hypothetical protein
MCQSCQWHDRSSIRNNAGIWCGLAPGAPIIITKIISVKDSEGLRILGEKLLGWKASPGWNSTDFVFAVAVLQCAACFDRRFQNIVGIRSQRFIGKVPD